MQSSSTIRATLCRCGGLIRLLTSDLRASLYQRIAHILKPPGLRTKRFQSFLHLGRAGESKFAEIIPVEHKHLARLLRASRLDPSLLLLPCAERREGRFGLFNNFQPWYNEVSTITYLPNRGNPSWRVNRLKRPSTVALFLRVEWRKLELQSHTL